jgi:hypothetical protein
MMHGQQNIKIITIASRLPVAPKENCLTLYILTNIRLTFNLPCRDGTLPEKCVVFGLNRIWFGKCISGDRKFENPTIWAQILNEICPARVPHISYFIPLR